LRKTKKASFRGWLPVLAALSASLAASTGALALHAVIQALDTDRDSTLDLAEVRKAASDMFDRLERDHDGTIERKEIGPRISKRDFASADVNQDGLLAKDEYVALAEKLFRAADVDNHGELGERELQSPAGRALARLLH
jgi:Ca2+-binding EF-hand superfamily protein